VFPSQVLSLPHPGSISGRRPLTVLTLGVAALLLPAPAAASADPLPVQVSFAANPAVPSGDTTEMWTVPAGVTEVTFYVAGGAGGAGANGGGSGGGGGSGEANFAVTPDETFAITVGGQGAAGAAPQVGVVADGGLGGAPGGGHGGSGAAATDSTVGVLGGGGGGGGASSVALPSGGETSLEMVAPGGGGGGAGSAPPTSGAGGGLPPGGSTPAGGSGAGADSTSGSDDSDGAGGAGGDPGSSADGGNATGGGAGTATQAGTGGAGAIPGAAGTATGGGDGPSGSGAGGGGDGFFGGGSGGGDATAAAGGGGGGFYVAAVATGFVALPPSTVGAVSIGYVPPPPPAPAAPAPPPPPSPHPAIVGTPAIGEPLTCVATTPIAGETFTYSWLRDVVPVSGATAQTYGATSSDAGHYLQCVVIGTSPTGTVTATSAFVSVPVGGAPPPVITTSFVAGDRGGAAQVALRCAPRAAGSCAITLVLSTVETLRGNRLLAVAASATRASRPPPRSTRRTVGVGTLSLTLQPGASRTVLVGLNAVGRRLLARERRLPVLLSANGTYIGDVSATLGTAHLTLRASSARPPSVRSPASPAVLAATPYMGWDTYFAFGSAYNEATILDQAHQLIARGLLRAGYRYIWFDVGWWRGTRDASGQITVNPTQWPHGLAWLTGVLHKEGFLVGLYTYAGSSGCGGATTGSFGHYQQDADTFAAWGFDAVKVDFCGGVRQGLNPESQYSQFHQAILNNTSHRRMLLSICNFLQPGQFAAGTPSFALSGFNSWTYGPAVANSWRTDTDVGFPHRVAFSSVLRNIDADAAHPQAAGPGHWNDPDYLAPDQGLSATAYRSQLSMWAMLAAPLMISDDLDTMTATSASDSANPEVIAIDQDPAGVQGTLAASAGFAEVWVKPLSDGSRAVALLNRGSTPITINASALGVGLARAARYTLRNVWTHVTTTTSGAFGAVVPGNGTVLYRIAAVVPKGA